MSRTVTVSSGGKATPMYRRNAQTGEEFQVAANRDEYVTPPMGLYGRFRIRGISEIFQFPQSPDDDVARVEFEILKVRSKEQSYFEGKTFALVWSWKFTPGSNFGELLGALRGSPLRPGEQNIDPDDYIGVEFVTSLMRPKMSQKADPHPTINIAGIDPDKTVLPPWFPSPRQQQPALIPAGGGGAEIPDPFPADIDDDL